MRGGRQSQATGAQEPPGTGCGWSHGPLPIPSADLCHPEALQFWVMEGCARPAKVGPFVRIYFLGKEEEEEKVEEEKKKKKRRPKKTNLKFSWSSTSNSFISKRKQK